jgi:hypothetical protein
MVLRILPYGWNIKLWLIFLFLAQVSSAQAQTTVTLLYTKSRDRIMVNCPIFSGVASVKVQRGGRLLSVRPSSLNRGSFRLPKRYEYLGCATNGQGVTLLFGRVTMDAPTEQIALSEVHFPVAQAQSPNLEGDDNNTSAPSSLRAKCGSGGIKSFPGSFIYKTIGSTHFSAGDVRRNAIGLVVKPGVRLGSWPSCVPVLDRDGGEVSALGRYAVGGGWSARYYAGIGCGGKYPFNGSRVAALARQGSGSDEIYFDFGDICYGPVQADQCVGSSQC